MLKNREELQSNLVEAINAHKLKSHKRDVRDIKKHLATYDITDVQIWLNDPENKLHELDLRELYLLTEQVFAKTSDLSINPDGYFTEIEKRESRQFSGLTESQQNEISFPLTFSNATVVGNNAYMVTMSIQTISKLMDNNLIYYNYETQREARFVKRANRIVIEPTLNKNSVKAIKNLLLKGELVPTVLVFNCETRTTSDPSGEELIYDSKKLELSVTAGTLMSVTDGFHRITAARNALQERPDLDFSFAVLITNYSTRQAQQYMAQISMANPVSRTRVAELQASRLSDTVVQQLKADSELRGRISQTNRLHALNRELVSYNNLADNIDESFKMDTKLQALEVADYLTSFFDFLIGSYPNEFINNIEETRKESLINDNNMIGVGYITLASRMYSEGIKARDVVKIIKGLDFSRSNNTWQLIGVLDDKGNITETNKARKAIREYFNNIDIAVKN